jgi:urea transporter
MKKHNIEDLVQGSERVLYAAICVIGSLIFLGLLLVSYLASLIPLI